MKELDVLLREETTTEAPSTYLQEWRRMVGADSNTIMAATGPFRKALGRSSVPTDLAPLLAYCALRDKRKKEEGGAV